MFTYNSLACRQPRCSPIEAGQKKTAEAMLTAFSCASPHSPSLALATSNENPSSPGETRQRETFKKNNSLVASSIWAEQTRRARLCEPFGAQIPAAICAEKKKSAILKGKIECKQPTVESDSSL
uniref:Uncharacterized protein n=1 Tax=Micrurus lemniscatus lemniscatus TaxID=129467 RepID=A0A2D4IEZ0_MICLE